jgi:hypothetical protein
MPKKVLVLGASGSFNRTATMVAALQAASVMGVDCIALINRSSSAESDEKLLETLKQRPPTSIPIPPKSHEKDWRGQVRLDRQQFKPTKINRRGNFGRH